MTDIDGIERTAPGSYLDEIGIAIGIYGDWRLKAAFRPIFACQANCLHPVAVEGSMRPFVYGREVDERMFRRAVPRSDRLIVAALDAALCLRNLHHTGMVDLKLILEADLRIGASASKIRAAVRALLAETHRDGLAPADVIVRLSQFSAADGQAARVAVEALCDDGFGYMLDEKGEGLESDSLPAARIPDVVAIDGDWFCSVARQAATAQLFRTLVRGYRSQGALVLIRGISTAGELHLALDSSADWLSGPLLAPAALAGAIFPEDPVLLEPLLEAPRVIPLFR